MSQVGHANCKMTLDVYAQMQQRAKRDNGAYRDQAVARPDELRGSLSVGRAGP
jgi:hypothetical protein